MIARPSSDSKSSSLRRGSNLRDLASSAKRGMLGHLERFFFVYGRTLATYPSIFILLCIALTVVCSMGLNYLYVENNGIKLWIAEDSESRINSDWLWQNHPPTMRMASIILEHEHDVLVPEVIQVMMRIQRQIEQIETESGKGLEDLCMQIPVVKSPDLLTVIGRRRKREIDDNDVENDEEFFGGFDSEDSFFSESTFFDDIESNQEEEEVDETEMGMRMAEMFSVQQYPQPYCSVVQNMQKACFATSLLELWGDSGSYSSKSESEIASLTKEDILAKVNSEKSLSGIFLGPRNFTAMLSGIERDPLTGHIISAKATVMRWFTRLNATAALIDPVPERSAPIDHDTFEFEGKMIEIMNDHSDFPTGLKAFPNAMRSFGDIARSTIVGDTFFLLTGYFIVFVYVTFMLGRFNCIELRYYLSLMGILGVVMGIVVSYGLCSFLGLLFGPMHSVMPFLMLGIGIDDMFVIMQCFETLPKHVRQTYKLEDRIGKTMQDAGVAITITSITDVIAFGIGGSTVLPALKSFCLYASVGIVATYFFQCTFFVSWFAIDQRRIESRRNGCLPCLVHSSEYKPNEVSKKSLLKAFFKRYANLLMDTKTRVLVLISVILITGCGVWGNLLLRQEFNITWFLPPESYLAQWFNKNAEHFPFGGDRVRIYCHNTSHLTPVDFERIHDLALELKEQRDIIDDVDSWTVGFKEYYEKHLRSDTISTIFDLSPEEFERNLVQFLFSPRGGKYRERFVFGSELKCGSGTADIVLSDIGFQHRVFEGPWEHIPAMNRVKKLIRKHNLSDTSFPLSRGYSLWETDEVIAHELYRNLLLAVVCVFCTTLFLISNFVSSLLVLLCVLLSLCDVGGFMHFWGLTIDTISCNNLIIAIGLCVDYSAHIAHRFMVEDGPTRVERVKKTLTNIGPAVFNGGFSTFLAFILLAGSRSHVFSSFFKIFFLVVTFGLYQGLVVLPVLLSFLGPHHHEMEGGEGVHRRSLFVPEDMQEMQNLKKEKEIETKEEDE